MIQINIDENKVDNFSEDAQVALKKEVGKYTNALIKEANLIEEGIREEGANPEITSNIVLQAVRKNKNFTRKKSNIQLLIIKIISYISTLLVGFLFDESGYPHKSTEYFFFIIFMIIALVSTVMQFMLEGKE